MTRVIFHPEAEAEFLSAARAARLGPSQRTQSSAIDSQGGSAGFSYADSRMVCSIASSPTRSSSSRWHTFAGVQGTGEGGRDACLSNAALERTVTNRA